MYPKLTPEQRSERARKPLKLVGGDATLIRLLAPLLIMVYRGGFCDD